jgi:hypothetical protein
MLTYCQIWKKKKKTFKAGSQFSAEKLGRKYILKFINDIHINVDVSFG